ncbi:MAG: glycoside hydrolase family 15 protein [Solirubrobacterales bacterium]
MTDHRQRRASSRDERGFAPLGDYGAIGNQRSAALVGLDGSIDWLCLPEFDSPSVFGALLDPSAGRFELAPVGEFEVSRRYLPQTNVLETTFHCDGGELRLIDSMTLPEASPVNWVELIRRVECTAGEIELHWCCKPRPDYGSEVPEAGSRAGTAALSYAEGTLLLQSFSLGDPEEIDGAYRGKARLAEGEAGLLGLCAFELGSPIIASHHDEYESRLGETIEHWRHRASVCDYEGPWEEAVRRSALALLLCTHVNPGAIVAAPTTSLPEAIGGSRNWDYRFCWLRDMGFTLEAMLRLGYRDQVHTSLDWMLAATSRTHPRLRVFYELDGDVGRGERHLDLAGYRGSTPVNDGNRAGSQLQLGNYGDLMQTIWLFCRDGGDLDQRIRQRVTEVIDLLAEIWKDPDASIWELEDAEQYSQGKLSAWLAFDRAVRLAEEGRLPGGEVERWRECRDAAVDYIEDNCFSEEFGAYVQYPGTDALDASMLLGFRIGYGDPSDADDRRGRRLLGTLEAVRERLGRGELLYRYSGMEEAEGAFLACSFWMVKALALSGRGQEARATMDALVGRANDLGLYTEQIDPESGELLGNMPQALTHLALINAAVTIERGEPLARH